MMMIRDGSDRGRLYPADRCTFSIVPDGGKNGYQVHQGARGSGVEDTGGDRTRALFFPGAGAIGSGIGEITNGGFEEIEGNASGRRPQLGYLGKTGRFVAITNS